MAFKQFDSSQSEFKTENVTVYHSGNQSGIHRKGVVIIVKNHIASCVTGYVPMSERTVLITIMGKPLNINHRITSIETQFWRLPANYERDSKYYQKVFLALSDCNSVLFIYVFFRFWGGFFILARVNKKCNFCVKLLINNKNN